MTTTTAKYTHVNKTAHLLADRDRQIYHIQYTHRHDNAL